MNATISKHDSEQLQLTKLYELLRDDMQQLFVSLTENKQEYISNVLNHIESLQTKIDHSTREKIKNKKFPYVDTQKCNILIHEITALNKKIHRTTATHLASIAHEQSLLRKSMRSIPEYKKPAATGGSILSINS